MNETLSTLAQLTADRRAEAAADLRRHGGEKDRAAALTSAIKNLLGKDRARLKKYISVEDYGKQYRAGVFKFWAKATETEKLEMLALEIPCLKIISTYDEIQELTEQQKRLAVRAIAYDLYKKLGDTKQTITKEEKPNQKEKNVLLDTLFPEAERLHGEGYDFEQISGILSAVTKGRLKAGAAKIAAEYYRRHPNEKPKNKKAAPM